MNTGLLRFERIEIVATSRAGAHADHDWLLLHWFVGGRPQPPQVMPLHNAAGTAALGAGDVVPPFACSCPRTAGGDTPMIAAFLIVELGAWPRVEQPRLASALGRHTQSLLAEAYVEAAEWVAETRLAGQAKAAPTVRAAAGRASAATIGAAFVEQAHARLSAAAALGTGATTILHDTLVFEPEHAPPRRAFVRSYPPGQRSPDGAQTVVWLALERRSHPPDDGREASAWIA